MQNRDKQIEEMAKIMCNCYDSGNCKMHGKLCDLKCISGFNAMGLYNAGYRKASEVAEEIFAEIEKTIADLEYRANTPRKTVKVEELKAQCDWILHEVVPKALAELKKKYIGKDRDKLAEFGKYSPLSWKYTESENNNE